MATNTLQKNAYPIAARKESLAGRFIHAYRENQVETACGFLATSGTSNVHPLYRVLHR